MDQPSTSSGVRLISRPFTLSTEDLLFISSDESSDNFDGFSDDDEPDRFGRRDITRNEEFIVKEEKTPSGSNAEYDDVDLEGSLVIDLDQVDCDVSFEGFSDMILKEKLTLNKLRAEISNLNEEIPQINLAKQKIEDKSKTHMKSDKSDTITIPNDEPLIDDYIGPMCDKVGCTVSFLESYQTKVVPLTNGIVYELDEFGKKISWGSQYVARWILRLRGYADIDPTDADFSKVQSVLKRRKAIMVTYSIMPIKAKLMLKQFDNTECRLPSEDEFTVQPVLLKTDIAKVKIENKTNRSTVVAIASKNNLQGNTADLLSLKSEDEVSIPIELKSNLVSSTGAAAGQKRSPQQKKGKQPQVNQDKYSNIPSNTVDVQKSQSHKKEICEEAEYVENKLSLEVGQEESPTHSTLSISKSGRVRKPTSKTMDSPKMKALFSYDINLLGSPTLNSKHKSLVSSAVFPKSVSKIIPVRSCEEMVIDECDMKTVRLKCEQNLPDSRTLSNLREAKDSQEPKISISSARCIKRTSLVDKNKVSLVYDNAGNATFYNFNETCTIGPLCESNDVTIHTLNSEKCIDTVLTKGMVNELYQFYVSRKLPVALVGEALLKLKGVTNASVLNINNVYNVHYRYRALSEYANLKEKLDSFLKSEFNFNNVDEENYVLNAENSEPKLEVTTAGNKVHIEQQDNTSTAIKCSIGKSPITKSSSKSPIAKTQIAQSPVKSLTTKSLTVTSPSFRILTTKSQMLNENINPEDVENWDELLASTKGCLGGISRGDIMLLYLSWLQLKNKDEENVFVTDFSRDVETLMEKRGVEVIRIPVGTLMSSSVRLHDEFTDMWSVNADEAKLYLEEDWLEDIRCLVAVAKLARKIHVDNDTDSHECNVLHEQNVAVSSVDEPMDLDTSDDSSVSSGIKTMRPHSDKRGLHKIQKRKAESVDDDYEPHPPKSASLVNKHRRSGRIKLTNYSDEIEKDLIPSEKLKENVKTNESSNVTAGTVFSEEEEFEVEKILDFRYLSTGKAVRCEFFVHWVGFSPDEDSWVGASDLNCPILLGKFWRTVDPDGTLRKKRRLEAAGKVSGELVSQICRNSSGLKLNVMMPGFHENCSKMNEILELGLTNDNMHQFWYEVLLNLQNNVWPRITGNVMVTIQELLVLYDDWRQKNRNQLLAGGQNTVNLDVLLVSIRALMAERQVREFYPDSLLNSCFRMTLIKNRLKSQEAVDNFLIMDSLCFLHAVHLEQTYIKCPLSPNNKLLSHLERDMATANSQKHSLLSNEEELKEQVSRLESAIVRSEVDQRFDLLAYFQRELVKLQDELHHLDVENISRNSVESNLNTIKLTEPTSGKMTTKVAKTWKELAKYGVQENNFFEIVQLVSKKIGGATVCDLPIQK